MAVLVRSCCANVALTTAIAMAVTAVYPAAQTLTLRAGKAAYSGVNVPVLTLASLESSLAALDVTPAQQALQGASSQAEVTQAVAPAVAEETPGDFWYSFAQSVAVFAAIASLPLWWIAFPITFPLGFAIQQLIGLPPGADSVIYLPIYLAGRLFPARLSPTATASPTASVAQSPDTFTPILSDSDTSTASVDAPVIQADAPTIQVDEGGSDGVTAAAAPRSKRPAKSAAATSPSTEALEKRDDVSSVSKGNATSSRQAAGQRGTRGEAP